MKKNFQKSGNNKSLLVPVTLDNGIQAFVSPSKISDENWTRHHGKTATGQQVNSMKTCKIGKTILLQNGVGGPVLAVPITDLEVLAAQFLANKNYTIQTPR